MFWFFWFLQICYITFYGRFSAMLYLHSFISERYCSNAAAFYCGSRQKLTHVLICTHITQGDSDRPGSVAVASKSQLVGGARRPWSRPHHNHRRRRRAGIVFISGSQSRQTGRRVGLAGDGRARSDGQQKPPWDRHRDDDVVQPSTRHRDRVDAKDLVADP